MNKNRHRRNYPPKSKSPIDKAYRRREIDYSTMLLYKLRQIKKSMWGNIICQNPE